MKKLSTILLTGLFTVLSITPLWMQAQAATPTPRFASTEYDFGTIHEENGAVSCEFTFRAGSTACIIQRITTSCGCTTADFEKQPVKPGANGSIKLTFDPKDRPGKFMKVAYVYLVGVREPVQLTVRGNVIERPRRVEDNYPFRLMGDLYGTSDTSLSLGYVTQGRRKSRTLSLYNRGAREMSLSVVVEGERFATEIRPVRLAPRATGNLTVSYEAAAKNLWGVKNGRIILSDGSGQRTVFEVTAEVIEDFSRLTDRERKNAPRMEFDRMFHHFGRIAAGRTYRTSFTVTNRGRSMLGIRDVQGSSEELSVTLSRRDLAVGESVRIEVAYTPKHSAGGAAVSQGVILVCNEPTRPVRTIRLVANVL